MAVPKLPPIIELSPLELELREMWDKAQSDFRKRTKKELRADNNKRLDDVLQDLQDKYQPKDGDEVDTKAKIGKTINSILKCIQMLGGLAAEGASIVFGPATLCFNAISFLIDVPGRIAEVYEGIGNLFEEMAHTLVLFRIYGNYKKLDPELKRGTHGLMVSFVRICGLSIKIIDGGTWHRIGVGAKVTFLNDDSGVKDELASFKELIKKQADVTGAMTLQHVITTEVDVANILKNMYWSAEQLNRMETGINDLVADMSEKKTEKITSDRVDTIARLLSASRDSIQQAKKTLQDMRETLLSSQWLLGLDAYKDWISPPTDSIPLLLLYGPPKSGKSFLIASIDAELRKNIPTVAVAYYAFAEQDSKSTKDKVKDDVILASALKSMALQLAAQNKIYAKGLEEGLKEVGPKLPDSRKDSSEVQWWKKLHFSKDVQAQDDVNIVLLFDGLERLPESTSNKFLDLLIEESRSSAKSDRLRLRILATGKKEHSGSNVNNIQIVEENRPDIKSYIERALDRDDVLQGQHVEMLDLLKSIQEELPEVASGSYSVVDQKLARIKEAVEADAYSDDVTAIIKEDPSEDPNKLARKVISDLNAALNDHDIKQLNELLDWAIFGFQYFTIDQIRAALFLNSGRSPLQPFEKKLKNKYKKVFILDDDGEMVEVDDYIEDLFRNPGTAAGEKISTSDIDDAKITMTISINHADLRTVQQFCWDLTERVGLGKFDFLKGNSDHGSKNVIHSDVVNAHYHMTEQLLSLLNDEAHEKTKPLVEYALTYLPQHLEMVKTALNDKKLGATARKAIAKRLVDLLSDVEGIKKFWDTIHDVYEYWASPEGVRIIEDWLTDPETLKQLEPKERRWVGQHTGESKKKGEFYKPITVMVAGRWLQDRTWNALDTFGWVDNFIKLQEPKAPNSDDGKVEDGDVEKPAELLALTVAPNGDDSSSPTIPPAEEKPGSEVTLEVPKSERIAAAAKWAEEELHAKSNSLWNERIGQACLLAEEFEAAIEWFDKAKILIDCHWAVNEGLALAYAELGKLDSACHEMEVVLTVLRSLKKDEKDREALVRNLKKLASWQEQLKSNDPAFSLYEEVLEVDSHEHETRCHLLKALYRQSKEDEARNLVLRIKEQPGKDAEIAQFLREIYDDTDTLNIIVLLALAHEAFSQATQQALQSAIDDARRNRATLTQGRLWLYHGILLARVTNDFTLLRQAVYFWEQIIYLSSDYDLMDTKRLAARYATQYYFEQATKQGASLQDIEKHFIKLQKIIRIATTSWSWGFQPNSFLASYYVRRGEADKARKVFMDDMEVALDILLDADPDNDVYGYKILANILMHTGDDFNALSAWSLIGPNDTYREDKKEENNEGEATTSPPTIPDPNPEREGPLGYVCDGLCDHRWTYASDMYICRYCPDTQFNAKCLERLKSNKLERFICHPNHSWLHVPVWSDAEALEVGKGKVRVRGELVDGKRVGGEVVDVEVWFEEIREKWGIAKKVEEAMSAPVEAIPVST